VEPRIREVRPLLEDRVVAIDRVVAAAERRERRALVHERGRVVRVHSKRLFETGERLCDALAPRVEDASVQPRELVVRREAEGDIERPLGSLIPVHVEERDRLVHVCLDIVRTRRDRAVVTPEGLESTAQRLEDDALVVPGIRVLRILVEGGVVRLHRSPEVAVA